MRTIRVYSPQKQRTRRRYSPKRAACTALVGLGLSRYAQHSPGPVCTTLCRGIYTASVDPCFFFLYNLPSFFWANIRLL